MYRSRTQLPLGRVHHMGEKIAKTGIKRDNDLMYYIKGGDV